MTDVAKLQPFVPNGDEGEMDMLPDEDDDLDDDIPGLESVSSSDYVDETDDEDLNAADVKETQHDEIVDPTSPNYILAKKLLVSGGEDNSKGLVKQIEMLKPFALSPFLFGSSYLEAEWAKWMTWFKEAMVLDPKQLASFKEISWKIVRVTEIMDIAFTWCQDKVGNASDPTYLTYMLNICDEIYNIGELPRAVILSKRRPWFSNLAKSFEELPPELELSYKSFSHHSTVDLCCLYIICYVAKKLKWYSNKKGCLLPKFEDSRENSYDMMDYYVNQGIHMFFAGDRNEWTEQFCLALKEYPMSYHVYRSRLQCFYLMKDSMNIVSDSIRLLFLKPDYKNAFLCYIKTLHDLGQTTRELRLTARFHHLFPSSADKQQLKRVVEQDEDVKVIPPKPRENDMKTYEMIMEKARQGSEYFQQGDYDSALLYYGITCKELNRTAEWRNCISWLECVQFVLSVQYCYANSLLFLGKIDAALGHMGPLRRSHCPFVFPPAQFGCAQLFLRLRRHNEARAEVEKGLELLSEYRRLPAIKWPGTLDAITECLPTNIEMRLLQLQAQLDPVKNTPLTTCRYGDCLQSNITTLISKEDQEFRGYTLLCCTEKCSIGFHPTCWRRFKNNHPTISTEKEMLFTSCLTPDCPGIISFLGLYDPKNKPIKEFNPDPSEIELRLHPPSAQNGLEQGPPSRSGSGMLGSGSASTSTTAPTGTSTKLTKAEKKRRRERERAKEREKEKEQHASDLSCQSSRESDVVNGDAEKASSSKQSHKAEEQTQPQLQPPPQSQTPKGITEDSRKEEDSVAVIHRHQEEEQEKQETKSRTKSKKKQKVKGGGDLQLAEGMFTLPERELYGGSSYFEEDSGVKFRARVTDPDNPFTVPEDLKEEINMFERSLQSRNSTASEEKPPDYDWLVSYFVEIFKTHGPLHPRDPILLGSLELVPPEKRELIDLSGGLDKFLLEMPILGLAGDKLVLKEEQMLVSETIHSSHNSYPSLQDLANQNLVVRVGGKQTSALPRVVMGGAAGWASQQTSGLDLDPPFEYPTAKDKQPKDKTLLSSSSASSLYSERAVQPQVFGGASAVGPMRSSSSSYLPGSTSPVIPPRPLSVDLPKIDNYSKKAKKNGSAASSSSSPAFKGKETEKVDQPIQQQQQQQQQPSKPKDPDTEEAASNVETEATKNTAKTDNLTKPPDKTVNSQHNTFSFTPSITFSTKDCVDDVSLPGSPLSSSGEHPAEESDGKKESVKLSPKGLRKGKLSNQGLKSSSNSASEDELKAKLQDLSQKKANVSSRQKEKEKENRPLGGGKRSISAKTEKKAKNNGTRVIVTPVVNHIPPKRVVVDSVVQTDPLPEVETFKDCYEELLEERSGLIAKLEESEDRRVQIQRSQTLEMEKACKKLEAEVRKELEEKLRQVEEKLKEEQEKLSKEKKDVLEQTRSYKAETKALNEKISKLKKDLHLKDKEMSENVFRLEQELERVKRDRKREEERLKSTYESTQRTVTQRAIDAEVQLLLFKKDSILRPGKQRLQELDRLCAYSAQTMPGGEPDLMQYREQLKSSFDAFQSGIDEQIRLVKGGREMKLLESLPNPNLPLNPQLVMKIQMVQRSMAMMRRGMVVQPTHQPLPPEPKPPPPPQPDPGLFPGLMAGALPPFSAQQPAPPMGGMMGALPRPPQSEHFPMPPVGMMPVPVSMATAGPMLADENRKTSSFDRIVEKLSPIYPNHTREDFRALMREVRRMNHNTLSGLSMDAIIHQVQEMIEGKRGIVASVIPPALSQMPISSAMSSQPKFHILYSHSQPVYANQMQPQVRERPLPPKAPPPFYSDVEYNDDNSCIICYEEMSDFTSVRLECGHRFHSECIRSWLKEQSTCPTCRNHALLPDEFPHLGR